MSDFNIAFEITVRGNEGGYNPGKGEAETYAGWDRGQHPTWAGWPIIDQVKAQNPGASVARLNQLFATNVALQNIVKAPYLSDFWNNLRLSQVNDQQLANNCFDCSVNPCIDPVGKVMQQACNAAIVNTGSKVHQLNVDGAVGPLTVSTINALDPEHVFNAINTIRCCNYNKRAVITPADKAWLPNWLSRLVTYKK